MRTQYFTTLINKLSLMMKKVNKIVCLSFMFTFCRWKIGDVFVDDQRNPVDCNAYTCYCKQLQTSLWSTSKEENWIPFWKRSIFRRRYNNVAGMMIEGGIAQSMAPLNESFMMAYFLEKYHFTSDYVFLFCLNYYF